MLACVALVILLVVLLPAGVRSERQWSPPRSLAPCSSPGAPAIVFPSDEPTHPTGPGAIVWATAPGCAGRAGAGRGDSSAGARISAISPATDVPGVARVPRTAEGSPLSLLAPIAASRAPHGQILLTGSAPSRARDRSGGGVGSRGDGKGKELALSEGPAGGPFGAPRATGGPVAPLALTSAYLGDAALLSPGGAGAGGNRGGEGQGRAGPIELRMHRYYMPSFLAPVPAIEGGPLEGLTLAMDYRSDALAVWERSGVIHARDMPGSGRSAHAAERVAAAAPGARIAALLSDDNRATLAWSETRAGVTSVYFERSAPGVRFDASAPRLLERFADPRGEAFAGGGPRLVRLSSESVMLAWTGRSGGHWVVRVAAVHADGVHTVETVSPRRRDSLLADLEPGPANEAYALWSEPRATPAGLDTRGQALYAARGIDARFARTSFSAPEQIAQAGAGGSDGQAAAIGVDPGSDRALAVWRTPGGSIDYSLRSLSRG